jgi:hypothetical protein
VKRIPRENSVCIAKLCLALLNDDTDAIVQIQKDSGLATKRMVTLSTLLSLVILSP